MLEDEVDEKYFLSEGFLQKKLIVDEIESLKKRVEEIDSIGDFNDKTIEEYNRSTERIEELEENLIHVGNLSGGKWNKIHESCRRVYASNGLAPTINTYQGGNTEPKIIVSGKTKSGGERSLILDEEGICNCLSATDYKQPKQILIREATKKGYAVAEEGDGVYINRPEQKRGVVQKGMTQTIKCSGNDLGVVVAAAQCKRENGQEIEVSDREYANAITTTTKDSMITVKEFIIGSTQKHAAISADGICPTLTEAMGKGGGHIPMHNIGTSLRIRKLTPKECWRLMGFDDNSFEKASKVCTNTQLYKQAGNSIVVNVIQLILNQLLLVKNKKVERGVQTSIYDFIKEK